MTSITLQTYSNDFQANLSLTKLLDAGIEAYLIGENGFGRKGGPIKLIIKDNDLDDACTILEHSGESLPFPVCPNCKSRSFEEVEQLNGSTISKIFNVIFGALFKTRKVIYKCKKCGYTMNA